MAVLLRGAEVQHQTQTKKTDRRNLIVRRAGKDPVVLDTRSSEEVLGDEIPYLRWAREAQVLVRTGHASWVELLKARFAAREK